MTYSAQLFSLMVPLVLIGLIITSGIGLYRVRAFALPISTVTATATIFLPVVTGISLRSAQMLTRRAKSWSSRPALAVFMLLVIYETVIATLALTHMAPPGDLACGLDREWARLFSSKNAQAIRRIQDRHQCCGLHSVLDRAWPFQDRHHTASSCVEAFDRQQSCFGAWRRDEQITGGLMLIVAIVVFLLKLLLLTVYGAENPFFPTTWSTNRSHFRADDESCDLRNEDQNQPNIRGQIEGEYRDDPLLEHGDHAVRSQGNGRAIDQAEDRGAVVQPSGLHNEGAEWRQV